MPVVRAKNILKKPTGYKPYTAPDYYSERVKEALDTLREDVVRDPNLLVKDTDDFTEMRFSELERTLNCLFRWRQDILDSAATLEERIKLAEAVRE